MLQYNLLFEKNPFNGDNGTPQWWPSYVNSVTVGNRWSNENSYQLNVVIGEQYREQFENLLKEGIFKTTSYEKRTI